MSLLLSSTYAYKRVKKIFHLLKRTAESMPIMVIITNNRTFIGVSSHHKLFKQGSIISLGVHKMLKSKTTKLLCVNQPDADEITFYFRENTKQSYNLLNVALMQTSFKNFRNQHSNSNSPQNIVNSLFQIEITSLLKQGSCTDQQSNRVNQLSNTVEVFPSGFSFSQRIKLWKLNLFYYYIIYKGWSLASWLTIMPNPSTLKTYI